MPHKHWIPSITAAACILAGMLLTGCKTQQAPPQAGPAEVAILTVKAERVVLTTELPGRINSYLVAEIRPQVSGLLQKRLFEEGTHVREGQILYQIDPAPYQATYDQAKAALALSQSEIALAEANLPALRSRAERLKGLVAIHAVGQQDYDDAKAALDQAEANLSVRKTAVEVNRANMQKASIDLSYTPIKAPISGRIGKSNITVGAMVTAYQATPLAVIQQLDPIYVDVTQASADLLRLRRSLEGGELKQSGSGQRKVRLLLEDGTSYPATGTLQFRDVTVDPTTGSMTLRLVFPNPKQVLLPECLCVPLWKKASTNKRSSSRSRLWLAIPKAIPLRSS
jgi:membrane fusion protein (multidrug efflux system)